MCFIDIICRSYPPKWGLEDPSVVQSISYVYLYVSLSLCIYIWLSASIFGNQSARPIIAHMNRGIYEVDIGYVHTNIFIPQTGVQSSLYFHLSASLFLCISVWLSASLFGDYPHGP